MTKTARNTRNNWLLNGAIALIACTTLLIGCSPEMRMDRLIKKHPHLLATDTVTVTDSILIRGTQGDTIFKLSYDTMVFVKDNMTVKHFYNHETDSVYIWAKCHDTVHHYSRDVVTRTVTVDSSPWIVKQFSWLWWVFLIFFVLLFIWGLIRRE